MNIHFRLAVLHFLFALGFVGQAYRLTDKWKAKWPEGDTRLADISWEASEALITDHGYHKCPGCEWATRRSGEHLVPGSWCSQETDRKQTIRERGFDPLKQWDDQLDLSPGSLGADFAHTSRNLAEDAEAALNA